MLPKANEKDTPMTTPERPGTTTSGVGFRREPPRPVGGSRDEGMYILEGKYRLGHPLAVGGMGSVWSATQVTLDRPVAVKFVDVWRRDPLVLDRFLREAQLVAAIHHPNVVDVVDFGVAENGEPVIVMELLSGQSLAERMSAPTTLTTHQVVHVMGQVLAALEAVHEAGILHTDMKPDNVMLDLGREDDEMFARLIDFGIAFSTDPNSGLRRGRFGTTEHVVNGTPEYMPPEQAQGRSDLDARIDVYAAAVMLYEMLTGISPFFAEHPGTVIFKVVEGAFTPLLNLRPDIPEIAKVVTQGMAHDREARPSSARELRKMLLAAAERDRISALRRSERPVGPRLPIEPPSTPAPRRRGYATPTVIVLGATLLVGAVIALNAEGSTGEARYEAVLAALAGLTPELESTEPANELVRGVVLPVVPSAPIDPMPPEIEPVVPEMPEIVPEETLPTEAGGLVITPAELPPEPLAPEVVVHRTVRRIRPPDDTTWTTRLPPAVPLPPAPIAAESDPPTDDFVDDPGF